MDLGSDFFVSREKGTWLVRFWSKGEETGNFSSDPVRTSASGQKRGADNMGSCLHELLGKDPPRRLGWDIECFDTGKSPPRDRAGESGVSRAPNLSRQMGFAETGKTLPAEPGAVGYVPIPQWRRSRGDRADLSDLVFEDSGVCIGHVT